MIIFDLDGTLLNTAKDLEIALNYALRAHNFPEKTEAETLALLGNGIDALVAGALPQGRQNPDFEPVFATFKTYYSAHLNDYTAPYPGIIPLLQELRRRGVKMGIVSNKFDEGVKALAAKFFGGLIDYAQGVSLSLIHISINSFNFHDFLPLAPRCFFFDIFFFRFGAFSGCACFFRFNATDGCALFFGVLLFNAAFAIFRSIR